MKRVSLVLFVPFAFLCSCGVLQILPPALNNQLFINTFSSMTYVGGINDPSEFAIGLDANDTLFLTYISNSSLFINAFDFINDKWNFMYGSGAGCCPIMDYTSGLGLSAVYATSFSTIQMVYRNQNSGNWYAYNDAAGDSNATTLFDYSTGPSQNAAIVYQSSVDSAKFAVYVADGTNSVYFTSLPSLFAAPGTLLDLSIDHNSSGILFVGTAQSDTAALFSIAGPTDIKQFTIMDGKTFSKVIVTKENTICFFYLNDSDELMVKLFAFENNALKELSVYKIYTGPIKIEPLYLQYNLDVVYHPQSGNIYVAFIEPKNNLPMILKIRNYTVSPILMIPGSETNSRCVKITADSDGNPVAAVLNISNTVHFYSMWVKD